LAEHLGKISDVYYGQVGDYPFLLGTVYSFTLDGGGSGIGCGGKYTTNMSEVGEYTKFTVQDQKDGLHKVNRHLQGILKDAKVNRVDQLKGVPVMVTIVNSTFKDFRVLTEVL
jgi:hypothetical protein